MAAPRMLMVCLGNICRSPMAEGIMRHLADQNGIDIIVDSAGTSSWHQGESPDERAIEEMRSHGIDISHQRSRPFIAGDFDRFDHILVMDTSNLKDVQNLARSKQDKEKVSLMLDHGSEIKGLSVPDPYFDDGFGHVFELLQYACGSFLDSLK